jgi:uncharacterized lipoprotein YajG
MKFQAIMRLLRRGTLMRLAKFGILIAVAFFLLAACATQPPSSVLQPPGFGMAYCTEQSLLLH